MIKARKYAKILFVRTLNPFGKSVFGKSFAVVIYPKRLGVSEEALRYKDCDSV